MSVVLLRPPAPILQQPLFVTGALAQALHLGDVGQVVQLFRAEPALVLRVAHALRQLTDADVAAREGTVRVLWAACELYARPYQAVAW